MAQDRKCSSCRVEVSGDLTNCPLCGKHIGGAKPELNSKSYPVYDLKFVTTARWYNVIRAFFWIAGVVCVLVNLMFPTKPYWCPYVLAALMMVFHVFIRPIKTSVASYMKNLTIMSFVVSLFLIFIDAYNHLSFQTTFGWSLAIAAPFVMLASVLASTIMCFCVKRHENELIRSVSLMGILSIVYFVIKLCFFNYLTNWPSLVLLCTSLVLIIVLELFKRHKLIKQLSKEFHI